MQCINLPNPFLTETSVPSDFIPSFCEYGVLLSDMEYEKLERSYRNIYQRTILEQNKFKPRRAVRRFIKIIKQGIPMQQKPTSRFVKNKNINYATSASYGFITTNSFLLNNKIKNLKNRHIISKEECRNYFKNFKSTADRLMAAKGDEKVKVAWNGQVYYWLNETFIPTAKQPDSSSDKQQTP